VFGYFIRLGDDFDVVSLMLFRSSFLFLVNAEYPSRQVELTLFSDPNSTSRGFYLNFSFLLKRSFFLVLCWLIVMLLLIDLFLWDRTFVWYLFLALLFAFLSFSSFFLSFWGGIPVGESERWGSKGGCESFWKVLYFGAVPVFGTLSC